MKVLSLLTFASVLALAQAKVRFTVLKGVSFAKDARKACEKKGLHLAKIKSKTRKAATRAIVKAKVSSAWIHSYNGDRFGRRGFLKKPHNYKRSGKKGSIVRARCDGDEICDELKPVLCYSKSSKKQHSSRSRRSRKDCSDGKCKDESDEEYGEEESEEKPRRYKKPNENADYY